MSQILDQLQASEDGEAFLLEALEEPSSPFHPENFVNPPPELLSADGLALAGPAAQMMAEVFDKMLPAMIAYTARHDNPTIVITWSATFIQPYYRVIDLDLGVEY